MPVECATREQAVRAARVYRETMPRSAARSAVVEVCTEDGRTKYYAVKSPDDLDDVPGYVESLTVI